jgi:ABC-2 type transport system ATP-binding protein
VLFLDEPTLGLDPQTRNRIWEYILDLRQREGTTIFLTTHYMDEADKADRIAIIDYGKLVAMDTPARLKEMVGKDIVHVTTENDTRAAEEVRQRYHIEPIGSNNGLTFEVARGGEFLPVFLKEFGTKVLAVTLHRPSLEDVFLKLTGHQIRPEEVDTFKAMVRAHGRWTRR